MAESPPFERGLPTNLRKFGRVCGLGPDPLGTIELTETEARHLRRLINKELTIYKNNQSAVSEIRLRELDKKLQSK